MEKIERTISEEITFLIKERGMRGSWFCAQLDISPVTLKKRLELNDWKKLEIEKLQQLKIVK